MENHDVEIARDFLDFTVDYYALTRRHISETEEYRTNSHGFSLLYTLMRYRGQPVTMTKFASALAITKQQLTKLVNDLEEDGYVARLHNKDNRRQVYISITDAGINHLEKMMGELAFVVVNTLSGYTQEEKDEIHRCALTLSKLFRKDAERSVGEIPSFSKAEAEEAV